jgi:serine protease
VLGRDGPGTSYDILQGVRYAAGLPNDSGQVPARAAQVINISIGGEDHSESTADLYRQVHAAGIFVVSSAGNANTSVPSYPASYPGVYSVSATERLGERASYSNYGPHIALAAPGGDHRHDRDGDGHTDGVLSTVADDERGQRDPGWARFAGTSMAAPHLAGTLALMLAQAPGYTPADFDADLAAGLLTQDLGPQGHAPDGPSVRNDDFGWGLLDAQRAVLRARERAGGALAGSVPMASPGTLRFGTTESVLSFTLAERGTAGARVQSVSSDADWLVVAPQAVSDAGFGGYTASVVRGGLATGLHQARVSVVFDSGAPLVLEVMVRVALPTSDADDNGRHWVVLLDPDTLETLAADEVVVADGSYHFELGGVAPGDYLLYAGTDRDSDGYLCDPGEACTALAGVETPALLQVGTEDLAVELPATAFQDATATGGVAAKQLRSAPLGFHRSVGRERGVPR